MTKKTLLSLLALSALLIFACSMPGNASTPDENSPNAIFTAAAQTASVQLTQAALDNISENAETQPPPQPPTLAPPLPSRTPPPPPPTAIPTKDRCDKAAFVKDVTVPDGTVFPPGKTFVKTWRVKNIGTCTWTSSYSLVFDGGAQMSGPIEQPLTTSVAPGETIDLSVTLVSPATTGKYTGNWQIKNAAGVLFAKIYVQIEVGSEEFAVTGLSNIEAFSIAGRGISLSADMTVNKAGTVTYYWILRENGHPDIKTVLETLNFASAETKQIGRLWAGCPHSGSFSAYLYVDNPNHQEFGRADFNCP